MKKTIFVLIALCLGAFSAVDASVTLDVQAEVLRTSSGVAIPTNSRILLVADTGGNGFGTLTEGATFAINSVINGAGGDDRIVGVFDMSTWGEAGAFQTPTFSPELSSVTDWNTGDSLALIWLPDSGGDASLVAGREYGIFFGPVGSGGDQWVTPTDGNPASLFFFTTDANGGTLGGTGTFTSTQAMATNVVAAVPEPSRALLGVTGLGLLMLRRRRR